MYVSDIDVKRKHRNLVVSSHLDRITRPDTLAFTNEKFPKNSHLSSTDQFFPTHRFLSALLSRSIRKWESLPKRHSQGRNDPTFVPHLPQITWPPILQHFFHASWESERTSQSASDGNLSIFVQWLDRRRSNCRILHNSRIFIFQWPFDFRTAWNYIWTLYSYRPLLLFLCR